MSFAIIGPSCGNRPITQLERFKPHEGSSAQNETNRNKEGAGRKLRDAAKKHPTRRGANIYTNVLKRFTNPNNNVRGAHPAKGNHYCTPLDANSTHCYIG